MHYTYVIEIDVTGQRLATCLPRTVARADLIDISKVGAYWARFMDRATGEVHDCAAYYKAFLDEERASRT